MIRLTTRVFTVVAAMFVTMPVRTRTSTTRRGTTLTWIRRTIRLTMLWFTRR